MEATQLLTVVQTALEDLKAHDLKVLDVRQLSNVTDYMVIATGQSSRQVSALANNVVEKVKAQGMRPLGEEGLDVGEWALIDLGDVVVHVMQPTVRDFYQIEKLWTESEKNANSPYIQRLMPHRSAV
ncbi:ribosome silencing factor [Beggiatoa alba]|nr:ribosome silencing factor [Beggiatoa alba]